MACNAPPGVYSGFGFGCLINSGWLPGQGLGANGEGVRIYPQAKMQSVRFKQNRWHGIGCECHNCHPNEPNVDELELMTRCKIACPHYPLSEVDCFSQLENLYRSVTLNDEDDEDLATVFDTYLVPRLQYLFRHWQIGSAPKKYLFLLQGWIVLGSEGLQRYIINRALVPRVVSFLMKTFHAEKFISIWRVWSSVLPYFVQQIIFHAITGKLISHLDDWARAFHESRFTKNPKPHPCQYLQSWAEVLDHQQRYQILTGAKDLFPAWKSRGFLTLQFLFAWLPLLSVQTLVEYIRDHNFLHKKVHSYHSLLQLHQDDALLNLGVFAWGIFAALPAPHSSSLLSKAFPRNTIIEDSDIQSAFSALGSPVNYDTIHLTISEKKEMWQELLALLANRLNIPFYQRQTRSGISLRFAGQKLFWLGDLCCFVDANGVHFVKNKKVFEDSTYSCIFNSII